MEKSKAGGGVVWAGLDTLCHCPRKRRKDILIFSKGSSVSTQRMGVGPGLGIDSSEYTDPSTSFHSVSINNLVCCLHSEAWWPLPFAGQELPTLFISIPASQLPGPVARVSHFSLRLLWPEALTPFVRPCPGMS